MKNNIKMIQRPKFIVFTDKDGTLNLEDKQLKRILRHIASMGGMTILTTGRTVGDVKADFKRRKIALPKIIIGDNGANIYATDKDVFLIKRTLDKEKSTKIIEHFLQIGGNPDLIRYTDGSGIFASKEKSVEDYYQNNKVVKLFEKVQDEVMTAEGVTKITLAGNKEQMEQMAQFVNELGFWTDMDETKFPKKEAGNYRLDIAQNGINKGEAVKALVKILKPELGYICVGNGFNDMTMFKQAIDDGMVAAIMEDASKNLVSEIQEYERQQGKGRVIVIPNDKNKANRWISRIAKVIESRIKRGTLNKDSKKRRLYNVQRVNVNKVSQKARAPIISRRMPKER